MVGDAAQAVPTMDELNIAPPKTKKAASNMKSSAAGLDDGELFRWNYEIDACDPNKQLNIRKPPGIIIRTIHCFRALQDPAETLRLHPQSSYELTKSMIQVLTNEEKNKAITGPLYSEELSTHVALMNPNGPDGPDKPCKVRICVTLRDNEVKPEVLQDWQTRANEEQSDANKLAEETEKERNAANQTDATILPATKRQRKRGPEKLEERVAALVSW